MNPQAYKKATKNMKLGSGGKFRVLSGSVEKEYEKKGMSHERAEQVGKAVAAKIGMMKYGKKRMLGMARRGK